MPNKKVIKNGKMPVGYEGYEYYTSEDEEGEKVQKLRKKDSQGVEGTESSEAKLSDDTRIGSMTWAELKQDAMNGNNEQKSWFVSTFSFITR